MSNFYGWRWERGNLTDDRKGLPVENISIKHFPVAYFNQELDETWFDDSMVRLEGGEVVQKDDFIPVKIGDFVECRSDGG